METLSTLAFDFALALAATASMVVSLRLLVVQQPAAIAIPVRFNEK